MTIFLCRQQASLAVAIGCTFTCITCSCRLQIAVSVQLSSVTIQFSCITVTNHLQLAACSSCITCSAQMSQVWDATMGWRGNDDVPCPCPPCTCTCTHVVSCTCTHVTCEMTWHGIILMRMAMPYWFNDSNGNPPKKKILFASGSKN